MSRMLFKLSEQSCIDPRLITNHSIVQLIQNIQIEGEDSNNILLTTERKIDEIFGQEVIVLSTQMGEEIPVGDNGYINLASSDSSIIYQRLTTERVN